jgi:hypothetical protein
MVSEFPIGIYNAAAIKRNTFVAKQYLGIETGIHHTTAINIVGPRLQFTRSSIQVAMNGPV